MASSQSARNVVVVGYGMAGKGFHAYLVSLAKPYLNLYGITSARKEVQSQIKKDYPHVVIFDKFDQVLEDKKVDVVVIATPNDSHTSLAIRAMKAGKGVVVDKPFAISLRDCDVMIATAKETGQLLTCFQNRRWDGDFLTVQKLIKDQTIGSVKWVEMAYQKGIPNRAWKSTSPFKGGGRYWDLGAHLMDQFLCLFPHLGVKSVYCRMMFALPNLPEVESHSLITVILSDGTTGLLDTNCTTAIEKPRFYVVGDIGTFQKYGFDPQEAMMMAGDIDKALEETKDYGIIQWRDKTKPKEVVRTLSGRWRNYYENLGAHLQGSAPLAITLASVRRTIAVLDAALESVKLNKIIDVNLSPVS